MAKKIELLAPAGSMANLKAAVSKGADSVYLGMQNFNARKFATNFNESYLKEAVKICRSNDARVYLTMNTLVKNSEINNFFKQLSCAYSAGIDAVIIQENSFLDIIKENYKDLDIHISTQAGVMNSFQANLLSNADSITLARELTKEEIYLIRKNFSKKVEIFCHGALCVCMSGSCLFSSLLGGRSGNRGSCAQPCRKKYDGCYYLSTKELCLVKRIPEIANIGVDIIKIEGRMRTPYYVASVTQAYRKAIDSFYSGNFEITDDTIHDINKAFSREFTEGWFSKSKDIFNRAQATGVSDSNKEKETYNAVYKDIDVSRAHLAINLPKTKKSFLEKSNLLARVYNKEDAFSAFESGADIIYYDLFASDFNEIKNRLKCKVFAVTPRIMVDSDVQMVFDLIKEKKPDGLLAGNIGFLRNKLGLPVHLDYNCNCFNDFDVDYFSRLGALPIVSPELGLGELKGFSDKRFIAFVHGKIRLMTLRHDFDSKKVTDEKGCSFFIDKIHNGSEIINQKELGLLGKSSQLIDAGINNFFVDSDKNVGEIVKFYRKIIDGKKADDSRLKKDYVLGWAYRSVI